MNRKINSNNFFKEFCKKLWKEIILGTSDTWSKSRLSQRLSKPAYYIEDWQTLIYGIPVFQSAITSSVLPWIFRGCISKDNDKVLIKLKEENKDLLGVHDILNILDYGETDDDHKIDSVSKNISFKICKSWWF